MSLARHFFREMRPLFRMLEEPLFRGGPPTTSAFARPSSLFSDPFFDSAFQTTRWPAVDLSEDGGHYIVEAEMPGIKKENINVQVGDGGHSITIEGKSVSKSETSAPKAIEGGESATNEAGNQTGECARCLGMSSLSR